MPRAAMFCRKQQIYLLYFSGALKHVKHRGPVMYSKERLRTPPRQVFAVRGSEFPCHLHQRPVILSVEHLRAMVLLDVRPSPTYNGLASHMLVDGLLRY